MLDLSASTMDVAADRLVNGSSESACRTQSMRGRPYVLR
jgi:hypothetical protein